MSKHPNDMTDLERLADDAADDARLVKSWEGTRGHVTTLETILARYVIDLRKRVDALEQTAEDAYHQAIDEQERS